MEKEKEENIWRGKMSPWQDKQQTREDLDFFWLKILFGCKFVLGEIFLGENFFG